MKKFLLMVSILAGSLMLFACGETANAPETENTDETAEYGETEYTEGLQEETEVEGDENDGVETPGADENQTETTEEPLETDTMAPENMETESGTTEGPASV